MHWAKTALAAATALLLLWGILLQRRGRPDRHQRLRDGLLLCLAILAAVSWANLPKLRLPHWLHNWDAYHYYVGGKYLPELGYTRLYECTVAADVEAGRAVDPAFSIRRLATGEMQPAASVPIEQCRSRFTPERWQAFTADVAWFRARMPEIEWARMQQDHGFNGPPVWAVLGRALAETGQATKPRMRLLALVDPLLLAGMWACVVWAFGWRAAGVAVVFWGTDLLADYAWMGGGYLRHDWLAWAVIGVCLLRRGRHLGAGFLLAYSALLRIFPVALLGGLALRALLLAWRRRPPGLARSDLRLAAGVVLAVAVLVPASMWAGGAGVWPDFAAKLRTHMATPLTNSVGLKSIVAYEDSTRAEVTAPLQLEVDPYAPWRAARRNVFQERRLIFYALVALFGVLVAAAVRNQEPWIAAVLGLGMVPVALDVSNYYYSMLILFALLWSRYPWVGVGVCAVVVLIRLASLLTPWNDLLYTFASACVVALVTAVTAGVLVSSRRSPTQAP